MISKSSLPSFNCGARGPLTAHLLVLLVTLGLCRQPHAAPADKSDGAASAARQDALAHLWKPAVLGKAEAARRQLKIRPGKGHVLSLDSPALERALATCPKEFTAEGRTQPIHFTFPMPDGSFQRFAVVESPVMAPELAAKFPQIKTYSGQGLDDPTATVRFSLSPRGLQAQALTTRGAVYLEPCVDEQTDLYASFTADAVSAQDRAMRCIIPEVSDELMPPVKSTPKEVEQRGPQPRSPRKESDLSTGPWLRVYRLAVAAAGEWTALHGGTVPSGLAAVVAIVNQVNGVYEREFAIRFQLVANTDLLIYADSTTDPYTAFSDSNLLARQNQEAVDGAIGQANYDLGTVFFVGNFGSSQIGSVCFGPLKASNCTGFNIQNDGWSVSHVILHELGHLFGSFHTWTGSTCGSQYTTTTAYEPGGGSTIMSYAGICDVGDNFQNYADGYFHSGSYDYIVNNITFQVSSSCPVLLSTINHPPLLDAGGNFTIPSRTPFTLTALGSDLDGDALTYCWEQHDLGPQRAATAPDDGTGPLFRSFPPSSNPARTFPQWSDILNNRTTLGEKLPVTSRVLNFRVTARDNRAGAGGVSRADAAITVVSNAGPFVVTAPASNAVWSGTQTVLWHVAGTTNSPINVSAVRILLSTNGGGSFPITLVTNTPNDGIETVALPDIHSALTRLKIEAIGNVFFAVSPGNFTLRLVTPYFILNSSTLIGESCEPTNGAVDAGETVTLQFGLKNVGQSEAATAVVELLSGNGILFPDSAQTNGPIAAGTVVSNSFSFIADSALECGSTLLAHLRVSSGGTEPNTILVPVSIGQRVNRSFSFTNSTTVTFGDAGPAPAASYPSFLQVTGVPGNISKVTARLTSLNQAWSPDLDLLLVGPQGQSVILMSDAGLSGIAATLVFDDDAPSTLPNAGTIVSGTYKPTNFPYPDYFYFPAPAGPYGDALAVFKGTNPNGAWKLFVMEDMPGNQGSLSRWSLTITTEATNCCAANDRLTLSLSDSADPVRLGDTITYSLTVSNVSASEAHQVIVSNLLPIALSSVAFAPSQGAGTLTNDQLVWDLGTLAPGTAATATLTAIPTAPGVLTIRASATSSDPDGNLYNNAAEESTAVTQVAVLVADAAVLEGNSGTKAVSVQFRLSEPSTRTISVNYATADGTALAGTDYVAASGLVSFGAGQTTKTVNLSVMGDVVTEPGRVFYIQLSNPTNAGIGRAVATISINDNDPLLSVNNPSVVEGNSGTTNLVFTVTLSASNANPVTVHYSTENHTASAGEDYVAASGDLFFAPGERTKTVAVAVLGDTLSESLLTFDQTPALPHEAFALRLSQATNALLGTVVGFGKIIDDDPLPQINISNATVAEGDTGTTNAVFTVTLSALRGQPTLVDYTTVNQTATAGADYIATSGRLIFVPGTNRFIFPTGITNLTIEVPVLGNFTPGTNKTFLVRLSNPNGATLGTSQAVGTILDDDTLRITTVEVLGDDFRLGFATKPGRNYRAEWTDTLRSDSWTAVTGAERVAGTGGTVYVLNAAARSQPHRFYRVQEVP